MYVGGRAEPLVFLTKIILLLVVVLRVGYCVLYIGGRAFSVSHQDYPCVGSKSACATMQCILEAEPLMYLTKINQGLVVCECCYGMYVGGRAEPLVFLTKIILLLVVVVRVCYCVLYIGGRAFGVSHQDYPCVGSRSVCVLLCNVYRGQSLWCI